MKTNIPKISFIIPAKNESASLKLLLPALRTNFSQAEIILVNDGSTDQTGEIAAACGVQVYHHPYSLGNGAAIKAGARMAQGEIFIFMDGDGQHSVEEVPILLQKYLEGYDLVVGARDHRGQASLLRSLANTLYNKIASLIVGQPVKDLTSGFRVVNAKKFKQFLYLLPNGFSAPSTITMAFFRSGYCVGYQPIKVLARIKNSQSHIRPLSDGLKFLLILYKMTILYSPLKIFVPLSFLFFAIGLSNYAYTYFAQNRFTNMSAVLISLSVIIFLIGLVCEQITALMYARQPIALSTRRPFTRLSKHKTHAQF